jgi:hypothetical protein
MDLFAYRTDQGDTWFQETAQMYMEEFDEQLDMVQLDCIEEKGTFEFYGLIKK